MRILLVDDSKVVHRFVEDLFEGRRHEFVHAFNGEEAIETISTLKGEFDLVLLDWEMPVMTGPETLERLKQIKGELPVIMMTSKNNPDDIVQMLEAGAKEYIMKPFTQDIIFEKIEAVLGKRI